MRGFKSIFVSSKHKINCFLIQEKYFQTANAVDTLPLTRGAGGWRLDAPQLRFSKVARKTAARSAARFSPTLAPTFSATCVKMVTLGHERSGHQVESRDLTSKKFELVPNTHNYLPNVFKLLLLDDVTTVPATCITISRISFYIGDLRSGQFLDLSIMSMEKY